MITDRQKAFRNEYRSRIMGFYDGYLHIVITVSYTHLRSPRCPTSSPTSSGLT